MNTLVQFFMILVPMVQGQYQWYKKSIRNGSVLQYISNLTSLQWGLNHTKLQCVDHILVS